MVWHSIYPKAQRFWRQLEKIAGFIVGVDGGVDAVRKKLYKPMAPGQLPDFVLPLKIIDKGYRVVYELDAVLKESSLNASKDEYNMRVRVVLRSLWALWDMRHLLYFKDNKLFSWQLWSHKLLRYLSFVFLLSAYFANMLLWPGGTFFKIILFFRICVMFRQLLLPVLTTKVVWQRVFI